MKIFPLLCIHGLRSYTSGDTQTDAFFHNFFINGNRSIFAVHKKKDIHS